MGAEGIEPSRPIGHRVPNPACLPIPARALFSQAAEAHLGLEPSVQVRLVLSLVLRFLACTVRPHQRSKPRRCLIPGGFFLFVWFDEEMNATGRCFD